MQVEHSHIHHRRRHVSHKIYREGIRFDLQSFRLPKKIIKKTFNIFS